MKHAESGEGKCAIPAHQRNGKGRGGGEACHKDVRNRTVPEMPGCGRTLSRDAAPANLLSTVLSLLPSATNLGPDSISTRCRLL